MKVYILSVRDWMDPGETTMIGVFSTKELAKAAANRHATERHEEDTGSYRVDVWPVDPV
jgi:hypothetical protein